MVLHPSDRRLKWLSREGTALVCHLFERPINSFGLLMENEYDLRYSG